MKPGDAHHDVTGKIKARNSDPIVSMGGIGAVAWPVCVVLALFIGYFLGVKHGDGAIAFAPDDGGNLPPEAIEAEIPMVDLTAEAASAVAGQGGGGGTGYDPKMPSDADILDAGDAAPSTPRAPFEGGEGGEEEDGDDAADITDESSSSSSSPATSAATTASSRLPDGERPALTMKIVYETAARILPRFEQVAKETGYQQFGIFYSEGLLLCATAVAAQVDVILESGTAGGMSAELMARFFADTDVKIYTVDADANQYEKKGGLLSSTAARLAPFANIKCLRANSFKQFPVLLKEHAGKRVGVFVDGPKREDGMKLCLRTMRTSDNVLFCGLHDIAPLWKHSVDKLSQRWGRRLVLSIDPQWRAKFGYLDSTYVNWKKIPKEYTAGTKKYGFGLGIFSGMHYVKDGAKEDNNKKLQRRRLLGAEQLPAR